MKINVKQIFQSVRRSLVVALAIGGVAMSASAQWPIAQGMAQLPADSAGNVLPVRISLITSTPGPLNFEHYGHTMLRVQCGEIDELFNYGIFNFRQPNFLYRFVKGDAPYMVASYPFMYVTSGYEDRKISGQVLNLTQEQALWVASYLLNNVLPGNNTYHYEYCLNNCATQPRDIIEQSLAGTLKYCDPERVETFRDIMHYYDENYPWQSFGIDLLLGRQLDRKITYREAMFVPQVLEEAFENALIVAADGTTQPLVTDHYSIVEGPDCGQVEPPTPWYFSPNTAFALLLIIIGWITYRQHKRRKQGQWLDTLLFLPLGIGGCLIAFLVCFSLHYATGQNVNILWMHPLCLLPAVLGWIKSCRRKLFYYHCLSVIAIVAACVMGVLHVQYLQPGFYLIMAASVIRSAHIIQLNIHENYA